MAIEKKKEVKEHAIVYLRDSRVPNRTYAIGVVMECGTTDEDVKVWWCGNGSGGYSEEDYTGYSTVEKKEDLIVF